MQIWSFVATNSDYIGDLRPYEVLDEAPTTWWKTRDEAFFAMLATRAEQIQEGGYMSDPDEDKKWVRNEMKVLLNHSNWCLDEDGVVWYSPKTCRDDYICYLVRGYLE